VPSEHRRTPRISVDLPARYRSEAISLDGRAGDISQDGMFFMSDFLDDANGEVNVELDLPDSDVPLRLAGEVRWVNDAPLHAGMGIRFINVTMNERLRLANFVIHRTYRSL
jgi:uncharacterized protein (TIGR02266 family)